MSKERARKRAAREREAGIRAAAKGTERERRERGHVRRAAAGKSGTGRPVEPAAKPGTPGARQPKKSAPRSPAGNRRKKAPVGRPDGPLARRRRVRTRLLVLLLLLVNVVAGLVWRDWQVSLAVLIVSIITAPLLAALLLRRR